MAKKDTHLIAYHDMEEYWNIATFSSYADAEAFATDIIEGENPDGVTEVYICAIEAMVIPMPPQRPTAIVTKVKN